MQSSRQILNIVRTQGYKLCQCFCSKTTKSQRPGSLHKGIVLGIGNPLLDLTAEVDDALLAKYDLEPDNAIIGDARHLPLYKDLLKNYRCTLVAGGSAHNTVRTIQWILKEPKLITFFGCVGDDDIAKTLMKVAKKAGLDVCYQVNKETATGHCCVLITSTNRSLVANLGASKKFTIDHFNTKKAKEHMKNARFFYTPGFFLSSSPESMLLLAKHAHEHGYTYMCNLSATFIMEHFKEPLAELMPYVDILFGNEKETAAFARAFNLDGSTLEEIAVQISKMPKKAHRGPRVVVITQGSEHVILAERDKLTLVPVPTLARYEIVDTNGAGDAFTGGFISQLILGKPYTTCIECGMYTSKYILSRVGCTFGEESNFKASS